MPDALIIHRSMRNYRLTSETTSMFYWALEHHRDQHTPFGSDTSVLQQLFTTKSLFRSAKLAPKISPVYIVEVLTRSSAPQQELAKYLSLVKDAAVRFRLAKAAQCHDSAIDALVELRDVDGLRAYGLRDGVAGNRALTARISSLLRSDPKRWA
ncbi:hypothetical protein PTSG_12743 [Salpingoeca rosetta]|uniref:Uncharacterized protein n=1 Tax=Salpingoeca rosetta (strain ATCC 50818 / BSB-021) TaxID=946362 RepID=F2UJW3_SALR5|nr:uncharacterized protein PTSG_12743 [Salpingoeca rosetta]EGD77412.1 hypothetical protein PTSG_12743 [Salpingoeca rosetta]|eukprot:XP_004990756.1 hypothetical protein PTSG_12743 [Salpingoeca rosetta]